MNVVVTQKIKSELTAGEMFNLLRNMKHKNWSLET